MWLLLVVWAWAVVAAVGDVCAHDADDAAPPPSDAQWRCAAQKAICFAHQRQDSCECDGSGGSEAASPADALSYYGPPRLFCRTLSSIVWRWEVFIPQPPAAFVVSVRRSDGVWLLHTAVSTNNFTFEEETSLLSTGDKFQYQIRIQGVTSHGLWANPCTSNWTSVLNELFTNTIPPVTNMTVLSDYMFSGSHVNVSVQWEPAADDMSCDYKIVHWAPYDQSLRVNNVVEMESHMTYSTVLPDLKLNTTYDLVLYSIHLAPNGIDYYFRGSYNYTFITPSCLELWDNNLTICSPPPPVNLKTDFLDIGEKSYALKASWKHGYIVPEEYIVTLNDLEDNKTEIRRLNGNITSIQFKGIKNAKFYRVRVGAVSRGGRSRELEAIKKISNPISSRSIRPSEIIVPLIISLFLLGILSGLVIIYKKFCKGKVEVSQERKYLPNMDKEPYQEKKDEPSTVYFDDEWEIPPDRLLVGDILGSGAFGVVHKGLLGGQTNTGLWQEVAVKMLRENPSSEDIREFQQEIGMMKSVGKHPHIVSIIGCCTCSDPMRLIVEYCTEGDLLCYLREKGKLVQDLNSTKEKICQEVKYAELLIPQSSTNDIEDPDVIPNVVFNQMYFEEDTEKNGKVDSLQPSDLLSFARQIAMGMEFLAGNRIVHRDLAARNVLVCCNKTVKISDFGLSRDIYEQGMYHKRGDGKVPLKWMAIESLMYQIYTTQSDIWSFGILLWEIVTLGGMPYPSTPASRLFQLLRSGYRMECPSNCSEELYEVMLSCWRVKPKDRPTFTDLRRILDSILESSSPQQYLNLNIEASEIVTQDQLLKY